MSAPVVCYRCCGRMIPSVPYRLLAAEGASYVPLDCQHCGQHALTLMSRYKLVAESTKPVPVVPLFANPVTMEDLNEDQLPLFLDFLALYSELVSKGVNRFALLASMPEV